MTGSSGAARRRIRLIVRYEGGHYLRPRLQAQARQARIRVHGRGWIDDEIMLRSHGRLRRDRVPLLRQRHLRKLERASGRLWAAELDHRMIAAGAWIRVQPWPRRAFRRALHEIPA